MVSGLLVRLLKKLTFAGSTLGVLVAHTTIFVIVYIHVMLSPPIKSDQRKPTQIICRLFASGHTIRWGRLLLLQATAIIQSRIFRLAGGATCNQSQSQN